MAVFYTIGHSNISTGELVSLLSAHNIETVLDVRSDPYSKYSPQFNKREIEAELRLRGFDYLYRGDKLGGKAKSPGFSTPEGAPDYEKMAESPAFKSGIEEIEQIAAVRVVVLMCSEADSKACHRDRLLGWILPRARARDSPHTGKWDDSAGRTRVIVMKLFTIGSNSKNLRRFVELLQSADVDCVIDARLNNTSQLAGYSKRDDLAFVLELLGIGYEHHPELAPDDEMLAAYRKSKDWDVYMTSFSRLIEERDMLSVGRDIVSRCNRPCLLCAEDDPAPCHRRLVAERWAEGIPNIEVEHLK